MTAIWAEVQGPTRFVRPKRMPAGLTAPTKHGSQLRIISPGTRRWQTNPPTHSHNTAEPTTCPTGLLPSQHGQTSTRAPPPGGANLQNPINQTPAGVVVDGYVW